MYLHRDRETFRDIIEQAADSSGKTDLAEQFSLDRFSMNLQSLERTYIDKVFALCDYYLQGRSKRCTL